MAWVAGDELSERVMTVVAEQTGWNRLAIMPASEIEGDLGCTGDDARELMLRMEREFGIDMSNVDFSRHFGSEGSAAGWPIAVAMVVALPMSVLAMHVVGLVSRALGLDNAWLVQGRWTFALVYLGCCLSIIVATKLLPIGGRGARRTPVTVQHLIDAARTRRWPFNYSEGQSK